MLWFIALQTIGTVLDTVHSCTPNVLAVIHNDLVLSLYQDVHDDASLVPLCCPGCGLVLDSYMISDTEGREFSASWVIVVHSLFGSPSSHKFSFFSLHHNFLLDLEELCDAREGSSEVSSE